QCVVLQRASPRAARGRQDGECDHAQCVRPSARAELNAIKRRLHASPFVDNRFDGGLMQAPTLRLAAVAAALALVAAACSSSGKSSNASPTTMMEGGSSMPG